MMQVAIDGPGGAGKSTVARRVAKELGFLYVDTGAMYRAVGLFVRRHDIDPKDAVSVEKVLPQVHLSLQYDDAGEQQILLNEENVSRAIRENEIASYASTVSAIPAVRDFLLETQRALAREHNVIMDGRDIGTVILPDAQVKIFLTASDVQRAQRRLLDLKGKGFESTFDEVLEQLRARDHADSTRATAPLRPAPDAVLLDTTTLDFEQAVARVRQLIAEKM